MVQRKRWRAALGVATALILPPCLGFRTTTTTASLGCRSNRDSRRHGRAGVHSRAVMTQLKANKRGKEDLMEKILPLIESVTTSREMVPSDLTRGYDGFVFPGPLSQSERIGRTLAFWGSMGRILVRYYLQERDQGATEEQWQDLHNWGSKLVTDTITDLRGYYVKTGQVLSTRVDLFPEQYTSKLQSLQDSVEPIPTELVKALISQELLEGEPLETLFSAFDEVPLGSASIAQVHKAVLRDGRTVAVKVQRPAEEPKLRADVANLKAFAGRFREVLPADYYPVFCELERVLDSELDFRAEAQAMEKIAAGVAHSVDGSRARPPIVVPRPVPGLCSGRVLVMEYVQGMALNRLAERLTELGLVETSPEARVFGKRLLTSLTEAFGRMIFGAGFVHGDPHPGNIFIMDGGQVALIDCGQVKQISMTQKLRLANLICKLEQWNKPNGPTCAEIAEDVKDFGVEVAEGAGDEALTATAILLFGPGGMELPGGYDTNEMSSNSPLKQLKAFPQELVLMGRATVMIKGIAAALGLKWNLAARWEPAARQALECGEEGCAVPVYAMTPPPVGGSKGIVRPSFKEVRGSIWRAQNTAKSWFIAKSGEAVPPKVKRGVISWAASMAINPEDQVEEGEEDIDRDDEEGSAQHHTGPQ
ncbi:unnamed protein product [Ectocarpus sp. 12 AP-2014]